MVFKEAKKYLETQTKVRQLSTFNTRIHHFYVVIFARHLSVKSEIE